MRTGLLHRDVLPYNPVCEDERGFTLIEAAIAVLIFVTTSAAAVGAMAAMAHSGTADPNRSLAISAAHNVLARVHASAAYYAQANYADTSGGAGWNSAVNAPDADSLDYAIASGATSFSTQGYVVAASGNGNGVSQQAVTLNVTTQRSYANGAFLYSVIVQYPVSASAPLITRTVTVSEIIPPPNYVPGTTLQHHIAEPMTQ